MRVSIIGSAVTHFGELWDLSLRKMAINAAMAALKDANMPPTDLDAIFIANMMGSKSADQSHLGSLISTELGISVDSTRVEAACASGGLAFLRASESILSGRYKKVLVVGVEKMTDLSGGDVSSALMEAGDEEWETSQGATFAGLYALVARSYMERYRVKEEDLALVPVKNHYHASLNPNAHFRNQITVSDVMKSSYVASPIKLLDCSPISDGAAALVLADTSLIKMKGQVVLLGSGAATDTLSLAERGDFTSFKSARIASELAFKEAGITPSDIDFAEVHDCFSIAEVLAMEDLGFYEKGKAVNALRKKETTLGGKLPINLSGGLKGCGHPVGATGVKQIVEVTKQLLGKSEERQAKDVEIGLTHNIGGSGATCAVNIFGKK
jgi:acetyl-CoA C-acetyltransferase